MRACRRRLLSSQGRQRPGVGRIFLGKVSGLNVRGSSLAQDKVAMGWLGLALEVLTSSGVAPIRVCTSHLSVQWAQSLFGMPKGATGELHVASCVFRTKVGVGIRSGWDPRWAGQNSVWPASIHISLTRLPPASLSGCKLWRCSIKVKKAHLEHSRCSLNTTLIV